VVTTSMCSSCKAFRVFLSLGAVLASLIKAYPNLEFTVLVRNPSHVEPVRNLGVKVVKGSFSDTNLISERARAADITINSADSDDVPLISAILAGQRARVVDDGKAPPVLLHTSGVAVFSDGGTEGRHDTANCKVWDVCLSPFLLAQFEGFICRGFTG
jgi:hypothetical protein